MADSTETVSVNDYTITPSKKTVIRVLGVGGGGGNALNHMIDCNLSGVEFIAINTDSQILPQAKSSLKVQIGVKLTNGLGAGCDPNIGRKAAEESRDDIKKLLQGSDMIFITATMGGGTGTGASAVIAQIAKEIGALTVAVVTKPFKFEGKRRMVNAESGISELSKHVDSLIVIDNDKLLRNLGANISIIQGFNCANDVLLNAVRGITDSITVPGFINLDFADVVTIMKGRGHAMIGNGIGRGPNFVQDAVEKAIHSPLIEHVDIATAAGLLTNIRVNPNFPISKYEEVCDAIQAYADEEADCKFGLYFDENIDEDTVSVTILITGISATDTNLPSERAKNRLQRIAPQAQTQWTQTHQYNAAPPVFNQRADYASLNQPRAPEMNAFAPKNEGRFEESPFTSMPESAPVANPFAQAPRREESSFVKPEHVESPFAQAHQDVSPFAPKVHEPQAAFEPRAEEAAPAAPVADNTLNLNSLNEKLAARDESRSEFAPSVLNKRFSAGADDDFNSELPPILSSKPE